MMFLNLKILKSNHAWVDIVTCLALPALALTKLISNVKNKTAL